MGKNTAVSTRAVAKTSVIRPSGKTPFFKVLKTRWMLLVMLLPAVVYVCIFNYLPMSGVILAFKNYRVRDGIFGSPWVGMENFKFLQLSGKLWPLTRNTLLYNLVFLTFNVFCEVMFAIMLNEMIGRYFKKISQTIMFLPYFVSWVVVRAVMYNLFNYERGVVNNTLLALGADPINIYNNASIWPPLLVFLKLWKSAGYGTVVYLAALTGQDREMFEAADIDGANIFQKIRYISIPSLKPTIIIMLLLGAGNMFRGDFGMFYQTAGSNSLIANTTDILDTFVFRAMMSSGDIGMAAASGLYQSVLCFVTILVFNGAVKRYDPDYSLF